MAEVQAGDRPGAIICAYVRQDGEVVFDDHIMWRVSHDLYRMGIAGAKGVGDITFADSSENNGDALREFAENTVLALSDCIADVHIVDGRQGKSS